MSYTCKTCGKEAEVTQHEGIWEVYCPSCQIAEYGETLEKALRCFDNQTEGERGQD